LITTLLKLVPAATRKKLKQMLLDLVQSSFEPEMICDRLTCNGAVLQDTRYSNTVSFYHRERIRIGENVFIWHYTILDGTGGITIGEGCQIGAWVGIFTHSSHLAIRLYGSHYREVPEDEKKGYAVGPVRIGKYTFIGPRSIIMPGVTVGKGCLVSAGSFLHTDIPDFAIVEGNPAKVVGDTRRLDARYLKKDENLQRWYDEWQQEAPEPLSCKPGLDARD